MTRPHFPAVDPDTKLPSAAVQAAWQANFIDPTVAASFAAAAASKVDENVLIFNSKKLTVAGNRKQSWSGAMTNGSATLTVASGFQSGDVGKAITVAGAGAAGATLRTTILSYTSGTTVTLAASASTTVSGKYTVWGTDDTAALQAAIDATWPATGSNPKRGGELLLAKGQHCMITGTLYFRRPTGTFRGAGWSDWAGYPSTTLGSMLHWDGPSGSPMIQVEGTTFFRIENLGLIGNPTTDCRPSSIIRFYTPTSVFNEQITVADCLIGRYSTYGGFNGSNSERVADNGIIMDGDNSLNDRFRIMNCHIEGATTGLNLPNTQSVVGKVSSTTFSKNDTHVVTYAQANFTDCYFAQAATRDFELQSSARVKLDECASELAPQMVYMRGPSTFRWHSGYFQVSGSTRGDKVIVDSVSNHRQVIRLIDVQVNAAAGWTLTDVPIIECHAAGATAPGNAMSNKIIELRNVRAPWSTNYGVNENWFSVTPLSSAESVIVYGDVQPAGAGDQNHGIERFFYNKLTDTTHTLNFDRNDRTVPNVQEFTSSGTWTKPAGAATVEVICIGSGGGGGSGRRGASGTVCGGGGGGAAGVLARTSFSAADLTGTVAVTIATGGAGGAAVAANDTNGNNGTAGGISSFGSYLTAPGGAAGGGGTTSGGAAAISALISTVVSSMGSGAAGGTGAAGTGVNAALMGPAGGPGGGGISATPAAFAGAAGANSRMGGSGAGGTAGAVDAATPTAGTAPSTKGSPGQSPGSGSASITTAAQAGANATGYGAGGSGGGASLNGNNSGKGGDGAPGYCLVITRF